jgi:hypothetical protein
VSPIGVLLNQLIESPIPYKLPFLIIKYELEDSVPDFETDNVVFWEIPVNANTMTRKDICHLGTILYIS